MYAYTHVHKSNIDEHYAHAITSLPMCNGRLQRERYIFKKFQTDKMADIYHAKQEML